MATITLSKFCEGTKLVHRDTEGRFLVPKLDIHHKDYLRLRQKQRILKNNFSLARLCFIFLIFNSGALQVKDNLGCKKLPDVVIDNTKRENEGQVDVDWQVKT